MIWRMCAGTLSEEIVQEMVTTADLFVPSALNSKLEMVPHWYVLLWAQLFLSCQAN